jgi:hypothetical protein
MRIVSGVATEEELFLDYKLFQSSLRRLLGDETANTILAFLFNEIEDQRTARSSAIG